jgi:hypothetical protein
VCTTIHVVKYVKYKKLKGVPTFDFMIKLKLTGNLRKYKFKSMIPLPKKEINVLED